jgi:uncharacterized membrane protein
MEYAGHSLRAGLATRLTALIREGTREESDPVLFPLFRRTFRSPRIRRGLLRSLFPGTLIASVPPDSMPQEKPDRLTPARLEAFSDGVIAVIITIMVLELHVPGKEIDNLDALRQALPLVLVYLLSFIQTGIYWVNHHYLVDDLDQVSHGILWANLAVLFSLSLIPAATNWVAVRGISSFSVALYGAACAFPGVPWMVLSTLIQRRSDRPPASGIVKQAASFCLYVGSIPMAFVSPWIAIGMIVIVAVIWLLPPLKIVKLTRESSVK